MAIFVIGVNHKTAPVTLREKIYFSLDAIHLYLKDLLSVQYTQEAVLLSTCNRSELYCAAEDAQVLKQWFFTQAKDISQDEFDAACYVYRDAQAVSHMMQVACGLDSMILGEPQILGQMKDAYAESCAAQAVGPLFHRLFQDIFQVAKDIRSTTAIGACPVSVASAAVHFAKKQIPHFIEKHVVLVGAGETAELLLRYLQPLLAKPIAIINRHQEKAQQLANEFGGLAFGFEKLPTQLQHADVVFSATGSPTPIINSSTMLPREKLLTLVDMAVPRDIATEVGDLANVNLFCIDHLKFIIEEHKQGREHAAGKAREMIDAKSQRFVQDNKALDRVTHTIRGYRSQIEIICQEELRKAKQQLNLGFDPTEVLDAFARAFTQKLLHAPCVQLRQAGAEGRFELLKLANQLFAIPDFETERL